MNEGQSPSVFFLGLHVGALYYGAVTDPTALE